MDEILGDLVNEDQLVFIETLCKKVKAWHNNESKRKSIDYLFQMPCSNS